jgi:hypothetical protein
MVGSSQRRQRRRPDEPQVSLASDNVFRDDAAVRQLGTVTGDVASGLTVTATIPVNPGTP